MQQKLKMRIPPAQNAKDGLSHFELPKVHPALFVTASWFLYRRRFYFGPKRRPGTTIMQGKL
jgi:hypothetical protein